MKRTRLLGRGLLGMAAPLMLVFTVIPTAPTPPSAPGSQQVLTMNRERAAAFARLARKGLAKEYPNKPA